MNWALFSILYIIGGIVSYFSCRKAIRYGKKTIGEYYTKTDRVLNFVLCIGSWVSALIWWLKWLEWKEENDKEKANW